MNATILLVEDNPKIMDMNRQALTMNGYHVLEAETIEESRALLDTEAPDLIILDIMLPDGDGRRLCEEMRTGRKIPILFVSGLGEEKDVIAGFKAGGDDYLPKPYSLEVLLKRVEALLHRSREVPDTLVKGKLVLDLISKTVSYDREDLRIKRGREFDVLFFLAKREGQRISTEEIYKKIWNQPMLEDLHTVRNLIPRIRKKLENTGYTITTVYGKGHIFERTCRA